MKIPCLSIAMGVGMAPYGLGHEMQNRAPALCVGVCPLCLEDVDQPGERKAPTTVQQSVPTPYTALRTFTHLGQPSLVGLDAKYTLRCALQFMVLEPTHFRDRESLVNSERTGPGFACLPYLFVLTCLLTPTLCCSRVESAISAGRGQQQARHTIQLAFFLARCFLFPLGRLLGLDSEATLVAAVRLRRYSTSSPIGLLCRTLPGRWILCTAVSTS